MKTDSDSNEGRKVLYGSSPNALQFDCERLDFSSQIHCENSRKVQLALTTNPQKVHVAFTARQQQFDADLTIFEQFLSVFQGARAFFDEEEWRHR